MKHLLSLVVVVMLYGNTLAATATSVSQFGVTWTFDKAYTVGKFVNGDWWVVGPVTVVSVSPGPCQGGTPDEQVREDYIRNFTNQFGDTPLQNNTAMRNGSMVNPAWGGSQGYDSGCKNYSATLSIAFPYSLGTNKSLVSSISHKTLTNPSTLPFYSETSYSILRTAAVLTCLAAAPPADAFRPPYAGTNKPIYRAGNLRRDLLPNLAFANPPTWASMQRLVERPFIDHYSTWEVQGSAPTENLPSYGREYSRIVSLCGLRLMVAATPAEKETLLVRFVQVGIDLWGIWKTGAKWQFGGGHTSGRKWPILFAGIMLNEPSLTTFNAVSDFHEDAQTYYGPTTWTGQTVSWQICNHHSINPPYEQKPPSQWTADDQQAEGYRTCCNAMAWIGEMLGALLIGGKAAWNHDAFFDYCDRWMNESPTPYIQAGYNSDFFRRAFDPFVHTMYKTFRNSVPVQANAASAPMKWVTGSWVADAKPAVGVETVGDQAAQHFGFNLATPAHTFEIMLNMQKPEKIKIAVLDTQGRAVATLMDGVCGSGLQKLSFDHALATGMYFMTVEGREKSLTKKVMIVE